MGTIDIIILCCFIPALFLGLKNGLVRQVVSFLVIYFGIKLSLRFSGIVSAWILKFVQFTPTTVKVLSFLIIFIVTALLLNLIGRLIEKVIKITTLEWLNKLLGVILAISITLLLLCVGIFLFNTINTSAQIIPEDKIADSALFQLLLDWSQSIFPYLKSLF